MFSILIEVQERVCGLVRELHRREREVKLEPIDQGIFRKVDRSAGAEIGAFGQ